MLEIAAKNKEARRKAGSEYTKAIKEEAAKLLSDK